MRVHLSACGPLRTLATVRCGVLLPQRARRAVPAEGSGFVGRPWGPTALRCSAPGGPGATRFVRCALCAQTLPGKSVHEARCARSARCLALQAALGLAAQPGARHKRSPGPLVSLRPFSPTLYSPSAATARRAYHPSWRATCWRATAVLAKPARAGLRRASVAARNAGCPARARSAHRQLTSRRECLSAVSAANEASCPPGRTSEYRSAVGPQGRPPQLSAAGLPGPALPPRPQHAQSEHAMSATGRKQTLALR
jgi:hypothetical protein